MPYDGLAPTTEFLEGSEAALTKGASNPYAKNTAGERDWNQGYNEMLNSIRHTKWYRAKIAGAYDQVGVQVREPAGVSGSVTDVYDARLARSTP